MPKLECTNVNENLASEQSTTFFYYTVVTCAFPRARSTPPRIFKSRKRPPLPPMNVITL